MSQAYAASGGASALGRLLGAVEGRPETPAAPARVVIPPRSLCIARIVPLLVRYGWYALERQPDKV